MKNPILLSLAGLIATALASAPSVYASEPHPLTPAQCAGMDTAKNPFLKHGSSTPKAYAALRPIQYELEKYGFEKLLSVLGSDATRAREILDEIRTNPELNSALADLVKFSGTTSPENRVSLGVESSGRIYFITLTPFSTIAEFETSIQLLKKALLENVEKIETEVADLKEQEMNRQALARRTTLRAGSLSQYYRGWDSRADELKCYAYAAFGKLPKDFITADYQKLLSTLDLTQSDDLMIWSKVMDVPVIAVTEGVNFFYYDLHLLKDPQSSVISCTPIKESAGVTCTDGHGVRNAFYEKSCTYTPGNSPTCKTENGNYLSLINVNCSFSPATQSIQCLDNEGRALETRGQSPELHAFESNGGLQHFKDFADYRMQYGVLDSFLVNYDGIAHHREIAIGIKAMPLSLVKALFGKSFVLSTKHGRSYAMSSPISTQGYSGFAGLIPGAFVEERGWSTNESNRLSHTLVHEACHVVHGVVVKDRYGAILYPTQYPAMNANLSAVTAIMGKGDGDGGFVSDYAKSNDQEDFAENCSFYIMQRESYRLKAEAEAANGKPLLLQKFKLMQKLIDQTDTTPQSLRAVWNDKIS